MARRISDGRPTRALALWLAIRPATLWASLVPVLVASALSYRHGGFRLDMFLAVVFCAVLIQVGTNLFNDYADFRRGADTPERLGPPRASQQGWLSPGAVLASALGCFVLVIAMGAYIVADAGLAYVIVGLSCIIAGFAYTAGPWPLAYVGLGEPFAFFFFGPVAVLGTYHLHMRAMRSEVLWAAVPIGALITAILVVNNLRDRTTDAKADKRTLAVRFGERFARREYAALVLLGFATPLMGVLFMALPPGWLLPLLALPLGVRNIRRVGRLDGKALNPVLGTTARLVLAFGVLLALGMQL